jgi:hypothetical protein
VEWHREPLHRDRARQLHRRGRSALGHDARLSESLSSERRNVEGGEDSERVAHAKAKEGGHWDRLGHRARSARSQETTHGRLRAQRTEIARRSIESREVAYAANIFVKTASLEMLRPRLVADTPTNFAAARVADDDSALSQVVLIRLAAEYVPP